MVSAGLRSGEARALRPEHLEFRGNYGLVYVEQAVDARGKISGLKGGSAARVSIFPEKTVKILERWNQIRTASPYYFNNKGRAMSNALLNKVLGRISVGIPEHLSPHVLRFTYKSRTRALVDDVTSRLMMGHTSEKMSDWYDRPVLKERAEQFVQLGIPEKISGVWG
jgi:integrase